MAFISMSFIFFGASYWFQEGFGATLTIFLLMTVQYKLNEPDCPASKSVIPMWVPPFAATRSSSSWRPSTSPLTLILLPVRGVTENPHYIILQIFPNSTRHLVRDYHHFTIWVIGFITWSLVMVVNHFINFAAWVHGGLSLTTYHKCVKKTIFGPCYSPYKNVNK